MCLCVFNCACQWNQSKSKIFVPVNGINQKRKYLSKSGKYLCPVNGINQKVYLCPVNGINQKVNICVC